MFKYLCISFIALSGFSYGAAAFPPIAEASSAQSRLSIDCSLLSPNQSLRGNDFKHSTDTITSPLSSRSRRAMTSPSASTPLSPTSPQYRQCQPLLSAVKASNAGDEKELSHLLECSQNCSLWELVVMARALEKGAGPIGGIKSPLPGKWTEQQLEEKAKEKAKLEKILEPIRKIIFAKCISDPKEIYSSLCRLRYLLPSSRLPILQEVFVHFISISTDMTTTRKTLFNRMRSNLPQLVMPYSRLLSIDTTDEIRKGLVALELKRIEFLLSLVESIYTDRLFEKDFPYFEEKPNNLLKNIIKIHNNNCAKSCVIL